MVSSEQQNWGHVLWCHANHKNNVLVANKPPGRSKVMLGANFDADSTLIMTSSNRATLKRLVSIMNLGDKTGFVTWL